MVEGGGTLFFDLFASRCRTSVALCTWSAVVGRFVGAPWLALYFWRSLIFSVSILSSTP